MPPREAHAAIVSADAAEAADHDGGLVSSNATAKRTTPPPSVDSLDDAQRARRGRIVATALEMMLEMDYERIQMKDISAAAGVALGTTYRYFVSKDHLLSEALLKWSERFPLASPTPTGRSVDQLKQGYRRAVRAFEPHPTVYGTMVVLEGSSDPYAVPLFQEFARRNIEAFEHHLPRIAAERRMKIINVMSAVLNQHLRAWVLGRGTIDDVYTSIDDAAELLVGS